jgi:hypothetical protein
MDGSCGRGIATKVTALNPAEKVTGERNRAKPKKWR